MKLSLLKISYALILSLFLTMTLQLCEINQVKATNVGREWGHLARGNNDQTELQWETWACAAINTYYPVSWDRMSCYGPGTTGNNVYNTIWWCQDYDNWVSTFFVGDFYPGFVSGTKHYFIYGENYDDIRDTNVFNIVEQVGNGYSVQYMTMIWTCANGGPVWTDYLGRPLYGYIDAENGTGEVGMTLAWTGTSGMSHYGYNSSDSGDYCYIGWENTSFFLKNDCNSTLGQYKFGNWVDLFYSKLLSSPRPTVHEALDYASQTVWGVNYGQTILNRGWYDVEQSWQGWCYLRVYGNTLTFRIP